MQSVPVVSIVDDDQAVRRALGNLVRSFGWEARMFESAEAFLASGEAADTACLVSDIKMTGMSGIEMHEHLLAQGNAPATIFVTAYPTPALEAKATVNGALVLLQKPYKAADMSHWLSMESVLLPPTCSVLLMAMPMVLFAPTLIVWLLSIFSVWSWPTWIDLSLSIVSV